MALALALAAIGWNQVGCCSRASPPGQFCSAYSSGENQSHDCCNVHCNLFDNNLSVTHCNILAKLHGELIGVCQLPGRVLSVACGMYRYVFYKCVSREALAHRKPIENLLNNYRTSIETQAPPHTNLVQICVRWRRCLTQIWTRFV